MSQLVQILIAPDAGEPMQPVDEAVVEAGRGIVGDRYHAGRGAFSRWPGEGRALTLIEAETLEAIIAEGGPDLWAGQHRRNLVTRGVRLPKLIGRTFRLGDALLRGTRVCTECPRPDRLSGVTIRPWLHKRPGLRADVVEGGNIRIGSRFEPAT